ncbi:hypothetical protein [Paenibacillus senegalensis]|uniref:hypothetical protein n=1 Tax=Paenibacillus senegalensis TaxID=1465766 RepID=UPI00028A040C|nr:hypothetical protein [Paenibacillus senegalensis]
MDGGKQLRFDGEPVDIVLEEPLQHPYYAWPETLLTYRISVKEGIRPEELRLVDADNGQAMPMQFSSMKSGSNGRTEALLHLMSDLPSGGRKRYRITREPEASRAVQMLEEIGVAEDSSWWIVDNGRLTLSVPRLNALATLQESPPVWRLGRNGRRLGAAYIESAGPVLAESEIIEQGPLFAAFRLSYRFICGAVYEVRLAIARAMDFFEFDETMRGFAADGAPVSVRTDWAGFRPTHRFAPNRPREAASSEEGFGFDRYPFEPIDRMVTDTHIEMMVHDSAEGELPFRLLPYEPWPAFLRQNAAAFWNETTSDSVGVFIREPERWDDGQYALWRSDDRLAVRFYYREEEGFRWKQTLLDGSRSMAVCAYDHRKDQEEIERLEKLYVAACATGAACPRGPSSHTLWLQQWYSFLHLGKVSAWTLTYPEDAPYPGPIFNHGRIQTVEELERMLRDSELLSGAALFGPRQDSGFSPVPSRSIYDDWIDAFDRLRGLMTPEQRRRITAAYLLMGYLHAAEDYMPLKTMLSGHPNFLADVKGVPALMAALFPAHPAAGEWVDVFELALERNLHYHVRPDRPDLEAAGGRWTENLGCYVWAFLKPTIRASYLLKYHFDGKNRLAKPGLVKLAQWVASSLTSPINRWTEAQTEQPRRVMLPQGAHARRIVPPNLFRYLGIELAEIAPQLSAVILGITSPDDPEFEPEHASPAWSVMGARFREEAAAACGAYPLTSGKFAGYGFVLRAGVGDPQESFVMLQQIDSGLNYRWGVAGQGGCGVLYYYANGRAFSHNGHEDVGDARVSDTDLCTNFGVFKQGAFRSIGPNDLTRPLIDLDSIQLAEVVSSPAEAYSWPEYQSRSVLMVDTDYIVVCDEVFNPAIFRRFSWFVHKDEEFPHIHFVHGDASSRVWLATDATKGFWIDGAGDLMTFVTHDGSLTPVSTPYGFDLSSEWYRDRVFYRGKPFEWAQEDIRFQGRAGWMRTASETLILALLDGQELSCEEGSIRITASRGGSVKLAVHADGRAEAVCSASSPADVEIRLRDGRMRSFSLAGEDLSRVQLHI